MRIFKTQIICLLQVGQFVHRIIATDPDEKPTLRYSVDRDNCEARSEEGTIVKASEFDFLAAFELNPVDGLLRVVKLLDRERIEIIRLAVRVEDIAAAKGKQFDTGMPYKRLGFEFLLSHIQNAMRRIKSLCAQFFIEITIFRSQVKKLVFEMTPSVVHTVPHSSNHITCRYIFDIYLGI